MLIGRFVGPRLAVSSGARVEMMVGCALSLTFLCIQINLVDQCATTLFSRADPYAIDTLIATMIGVAFLLGLGAHLI